MNKNFEEIFGSEDQMRDRLLFDYVLFFTMYMFKEFAYTLQEELEPEKFIEMAVKLRANHNKEIIAEALDTYRKYFPKMSETGKIKILNQIGSPDEVENRFENALNEIQEKIKSFLTKDNEPYLKIIK